MERVRGQSDVAMTPEGVEQVKADARTLVRLGGLDRMYHSDLGRAKKVAEIITAKMPAVAPMNLGDALLPWNLGKFQGQPVSEVKDLIADYVYHPGRKVPGGESFNDFKDRFLPTFRSLMSVGKDRKVGIAAHGRTDALASAWVMAGCPSDYSIVVPAMFQKFPTGTILYIDCRDLTMGHVSEDSTFQLQPGVYLIRHGKTIWNGDSQTGNAMTS